MNPPWARPAVRLPILIIHDTAGAAPPPQCGTRVKAEPASTLLDEAFVISNDYELDAWARTGPCDGRWYFRQTKPLHIRHGGWLPSIIAVQERRDAFSGLPHLLDGSACIGSARE